MKKIIYLTTLVCLFVSCRSFREIKALQSCNFRALSVENIQLSGINLKSKKSMTDFSMTEGLQIGKDYASKKLILSYRIPIEAQNPNSKLAALNRLEWKLMFDDVEILNGISSSRVEIPAQQTSVFPLDISMNISDIISKKSFQELQDLALNLEDEYKKGNRLKLKIKPYLRVGKKQIPYPGFIPVKF